MTKKRAARSTRIKVDVTQQEIDRGTRNDSMKCMVSQAVARTVPDATNIETDIQTIRFSVPVGPDSRERWIFHTPAVVAEYVVAFDAGDPIEPFTFRLYDPTRRPMKVATKRGRAAHKAYDAARAEAERSGATSDEAKAAGRKAYQQASKDAAGEGPMFTAPAGYTKRPAPPSRAKQRSYGHRLLRINQPRAQ